MLAMADPFECGMELPLEIAGDTLPEDLGDLHGGQFNETEFTGSLEKFVDGEGLAKDKVEAIFHLAEGMEATQIQGLTFSFGELGAQGKRPVIKSLLQQFRGQTVGSLLESLRVLHGEKGIVLFSDKRRGFDSIRLRQKNGR